MEHAVLSVRASVVKLRLQDDRLYVSSGAGIGYGKNVPAFRENTPRDPCGTRPDRSDVQEP
jgi:hypothetical protein